LAQHHVLHASTEREIETAFATLAQLGADALVIGADMLFVGRAEQLVALARRMRSRRSFRIVHLPLSMA
jgi:putative ABC transport system substrate-binding protein